MWQMGFFTTKSTKSTKIGFDALRALILLPFVHFVISVVNSYGR